MFIGVPSIHHHILFQRHGYGLNLSDQFPNYRADPNTCNFYGTTPLHVLSLTNFDIEVAEELIKSGAEVNAVNHFGSTPLHFAVIHRNQWMLDILIKHGADVNMQDMNGDSALHFAIRNSRNLLYLPEYQTGDLLLVRKLISSGAGIDISNKDGETPLISAIIEDNLDIVKELLAFGANVNIRKTKFQTCLHVASRNVKQSFGILIELVKHGACMNCLDQDGRTALDVFLHSRSLHHGFKIAKALIKVAILVNFEHELDLQVAKEFLILNEFIRKCAVEVRRMKSIKYNEEFSLCHFVLNRQCSADLSEEKIFDKVLVSLSVCTFPIYRDDIMANFKRSYLCKKLLNIDIYAKNKNSDGNIYLNRDVISVISSFLSDGDVFNFIRAYIKPIHKL